MLNGPLLNKGTGFTEQECEPVPIAKDEPLRLELAHFLGCVRERQTPKVSGAQAKVALEVAFEINRQIAATR